jgi:uncharacterized membrane protein
MKNREEIIKEITEEREKSIKHIQVLDEMLKNIGIEEKQTASKGTEKTPQTPPQLPPIPTKIEVKKTSTTILKAGLTEEFIGTKILPWGGSLLLFLGVLFFIQYIYRAITPSTQLALGFLTGCGLLIGGAWLRKIKTNLKTTAESLVATGTLVLYGATLCGQSYYHFQAFTDLNVTLLLTLITGFSIIYSAKISSTALSGLGLVGGLITPLFLSIDYKITFFVYLIGLNLLIIVIGTRPCIEKSTHWTKTFLRITSLGTLIWVSAFCLKHHQKYFSIDATAIIASFVLFPTLYLASAKYGKKVGMRADIIDSLTSITSFSSFGYLFAYTANPQSLAQSVPILVAFLSFIAFKSYGISKKAVNLVLLTVVLAYSSLYVTANIEPFSLKISIITALTLSSYILTVAYSEEVSKKICIATLSNLTVQFITMLIAPINVSGITPVAFIALNTISAYYTENTQLKKHLNLFTLVLAILFFPIAFKTGGIAITIGWGVLAAVTLILGVTRNLKELRIASYFVFALTALKLLALDLSSLNPMYRIIAFIAIALLALGGSTIYQISLSKINKKEK